MERIVAELVRGDERLRNLDPKIMGAAVEAVRGIFTMPEIDLLQVVMNVQNLAFVMKDRRGDRQALTIFGKYDRYHCRLIENGLPVERADEMSIMYLRYLAAEARIRLRLSQDMGYGRSVGIAEEDGDFTAITGLCNRAVQNCLGLDGDVISGKR